MRFNGDDFNPTFTIDSFSTDLTIGSLNKGDTLSYVYTLTAQGTTHGFERGYFAFLGDPFGAESVADNLGVTVTATAGVPEASTCFLMVLGLAALSERRFYLFVVRTRREEGPDVT